MNKVVSLKKIEKICNKERKKGKIIVFTNGCFSIIHPGHIRLLKKAKKLGDILILGLNSDKSIKKIKKQIIIDEQGRAKILSSIIFVDYIVLFDEKTPENLIKTIKPDILVKGADYKIEEIIGREYSKKVVRIPIIKKYSTSKIINKIK